MNEFKISIELYTDEGNFGFLRIFDNRERSNNKLPDDSFAIENVTPEEIGNFIINYLKRNCI